MKNDGPVKGQVERQEKVWETQGIEHPGLDGSKKRHTTFYIWVPERKMTLSDSFNPDKAKGIKKSGKVTFYQQDLARKNVREIKQSYDEKAENNINRLNCWASERHY